ncbi:MAG: BamA/TamA family outer membrane protein [Longimicrobiales bacterium]|nr:BamA/TamA family outer membrane protein [Longimicrobiales bacterium]
MPPRRPLLPALSLLGLLLPAGASAQVCPDGVITTVFVDNHSIFDLDELPVDRLRWAFQLANSVHIRTRRGFIRGELLFEEGDCYDPFLLADSERILRRFLFIANAEVYGLRQPDGNWHVIVDTFDEWSTRIEVTARVDNGIDLRRLALSERNFLGYGVSVTGFLRQTDASRQIGAEFFTPRLFGTETDFRIAAGDTRTGSFYSADLFYPFVGEVGRWAWRAFGSSQEDFFDFSAGTPARPGHVLLPVRERLVEFTLLRRFGRPGSLSVAGLGLSQEDVETLAFPGDVRRVEGRNFGDLLPADSTLAAELVPQTRFSSGLRLNLLFGQRNIRFIQRTGLDALKGVSDIEIGSDLSLTLSRTLASGFGGESPDDIGVRLRLYGGAATSSLLLIADGALEARQIFSDPGDQISGWRDIVSESSLLLYLQPAGSGGRHTLFARLSGAGGWTLDRPFQLTLGGLTGVRGFEDDDFPGAYRLVANLEDRIFLGWPAPDLFDMGLTLFADAGRMWAGDVPFGLDSGWRGSVGAGLRLGFPSGTRGVARIDLAWPVDGSGVGSTPMFRIVMSELLGLERGTDVGMLRRTQLLEVGADRFAPRR